MNYFLQALGIVKQSQDATIERNVSVIERSFAKSSASDSEKTALTQQVVDLKRALAEKDRHMQEEITRAVAKVESEHKSILKEAVEREQAKAETSRKESVEYVENLWKSERKANALSFEMKEKEFATAIALETSKYNSKEKEMSEALTKEKAKHDIEIQVLQQQVRAKEEELIVLRGELSVIKSSYQEVTKRVIISEEAARKEKVRTDELNLKVDKLAKQLASVGAISQNISLKNPNEVAAPLISQISETKFTPAEVTKIYEGSKVFPGGNMSTFLDSVPKDSIGKAAVSKIELPDNLAERLKSLKASSTLVIKTPTSE